MICKKCGTEVVKGLFCGNCGANLLEQEEMENDLEIEKMKEENTIIAEETKIIPEPAIEEKVEIKENIVKQETIEELVKPKEQIQNKYNNIKQEKTNTKKVKSGKNKAPAIVGSILIILILITIVVGTYLFAKSLSAETVGEEFILSVMQNEKEKLYNMIIKEENDFITKETFYDYIGSEYYEEIKNLEVEIVGLEEYFDEMTITYFVKGTIDGEEEEDELDVELKKVENTFGMFETWEIDTSAMMIEDYKISVKKGTKVTIEDIELSDKYLDSSMSTEETDVYIIPQIFNESYDIKLEYKTGKILETRIYTYSKEFSDSLEDLEVTGLGYDIVQESLMNLEGLWNDILVEDVMENEEFYGFSNLKYGYDYLVNVTNGTGYKDLKMYIAEEEVEELEEDRLRVVAEYDLEVMNSEEMIVENLGAELEIILKYDLEQQKYLIEEIKKLEFLENN